MRVFRFLISFIVFFAHLAYFRRGINTGSRKNGVLESAPSLQAFSVTLSARCPLWSFHPLEAW